LSKLEKETEHKMEILFRNTHAVAMWVGWGQGFKYW
jgi:hypothetical protein